MELSMNGVETARRLHSGTTPRRFPYGVSAYTQLDGTPGAVNWKTVPHGTRGDAQKRPPWDSMIDRQIESPMPMPSGFVVKKGSKMRCAIAGSSPGPVSPTATSTLLD